MLARSRSLGEEHALLLFLAAVGKTGMVAGDHELERPGNSLAQAPAGFNRTGGRMVEPGVSAFEPSLKLHRVFAKIVQQAGGVPPLAGAEFGRALAREVRDPVEVVAQRLPVSAVGPAGGMGEIGALWVQGASTNYRLCISFSKTSDRGNPVPGQAPWRASCRPAGADQNRAADGRFKVGMIALLGKRSDARDRRNTQIQGLLDTAKEGGDGMEGELRQVGAIEPRRRSRCSWRPTDHPVVPRRRARRHPRPRRCV